MLQQNRLVHRQAYSLLRVERIMTTNDVPAEQFASSSSISRRRITMEYFGGVLPGLLCMNTVVDYVGGGDSMPYVTAVQFFQRYNVELADDPTKPEYVIAQQFRRHEVLFREHPSALQLLPDPSERANISKRRWEVLMYRARSILDFLDQGHDGDVILFHFLHSLAAKLPRAHASVLHDFPHPGECRDDRLQWRRIALEYALQVHVLSDEAKKGRAQRVDLTDASSSNYTGGSLSADVLHALPGFFFSFDYLKNLACASSEMKTRRAETRSIGMTGASHSTQSSLLMV